MKTEIKEITPAIAQELLKKNSINRKLTEMIVNEISRQMSAGLWKEETGEAIKIAEDGTLIDGQHRLTALIKSGITLRFLVVSGLEKEVFSVLDTGKKRSAGDVLFIGNVPNSTNMAAGIRRYLNLKAGRSLAKDQKSISNTEIFSVYKYKSVFWDSVMQMAEKWYKDSMRILNMSEFIGMYVYLRDINDDDAFHFIDKLSNGIGLEINDPIYLLREKLLLAKLNTRFNLIQTVKTALIIKAWNHYRTGTKLKMLKYDIERDTFPKPI